ncbi:MAG: hypothetical protein QM783_11770 [Phycisphaerales bacterium]
MGIRAGYAGFSGVAKARLDSRASTDTGPIFEPVLDSTTKHLIVSLTSKAAFTLGGLFLLYWACFVLRKPRRFCPGVRRPFAAWLWPFTWITFPLCGYDLTSLPVKDGEAQCPECGRLSKAKQRRRTAGSLAHRRIGVLLICVGLFPPAALFVRSGKWAAYLPTTALLAARWSLGTWTPSAVRLQIDNRCNPYVGEKGESVREIPLWQWQQRWAVSLYIDDLRDDDVANNADDALYTLEWFPQAMTTPLLEAALRSNDHQQRQYAASILRGRSGFVPTDDLLRVIVEALEDDYTGKRMSWLGMGNARECFDYLLARPGVAEAYIGRGIASKDGQQRFLCAVIAAATRREALAAQACPVLIDSLGNDGVSENAKFAAAALLRLGTPALPYLEPACSDDDDQRRQVACLLRDRIIEPRGPATRLLASDAASISELVLEPSLLNIDHLERRFWDFPALSTHGR